MKILFNDFKTQYHNLKSDIDSAVARVLESGWYILGSEVKQFEAEFAHYTESKYCVGVSCGTEAIALSLMALGVGEGDEVITTNVTAYPTITGIVQAGASPVTIDVDISNGLLDYSAIERKISNSTKAIVPVHLYGQSCDMDEIARIAEKHGLQIVEDCAQSAGTRFKNKMVGNFGACGAFSFYPTKNLGAFGDAGAVTTNDEKIYGILLKLRNYGQVNRYEHSVPGINSRLDELQAAILRVKLKHLESALERRRAIARMYIAEIKVGEFLKPNENSENSYHLFVIKSECRDGLMKHLEEKGIQTLIHYPIPVNEQKVFRGQKNEVFENSRNFCDSILSLPIYPELTDTQVKYIIKAVNDYKS